MVQAETVAIIKIEGQHDVTLIFAGDIVEIEAKMISNEPSKMT